MTQPEYQNELRKAWAKLIEEYPHLYNWSDYAKACEQAGILIF